MVRAELHDDLVVERAGQLPAVAGARVGLERDREVVIDLHVDRRRRVHLPAASPTAAAVAAAAVAPAADGDRRDEQQPEAPPDHPTRRTAAPCRRGTHRASLPERHRLAGRTPPTVRWGWHHRTPRVITLAPARSTRSTERVGNESISVLVADDSVIIREGVRAMLAREADLEVVGVGRGLRRARRRRRGRTTRRSIVSDIRMPPNFQREGIDACKEIRKRHPGTGVVILSQYDDPDYAISLLSEGAAGYAYLLKDRIAEGDQLARAIREVATGGSMLDPAIVERADATRCGAPAG